MGRIPDERFCLSPITTGPACQGSRWEPELGSEFRFQEFLDEAANAGPHPGFQGIEPIVPKEKCPFDRRRFCGIRFHGVISLGATTPIRLVETTRRLRHLQIPTTFATTPKRNLEAVKRHGFKSLFPVTPTQMKICMLEYAKGAPAAKAAKKAGVPVEAFNLYREQDNFSGDLPGNQGASRRRVCPVIDRQ